MYQGGIDGVLVFMQDRHRASSVSRAADHHSREGTLWIGRRSRTRLARRSGTEESAATKQQTMVGKTKEHMNRIKLGLLAVASACLLTALPARANLVVNGGFETGTFPPWTAANAVITSVPANVFAGTYAAQLNATISSITQ